MRRLTSALLLSLSTIVFAQNSKVKPKVILGIMGSQIDGDQLAGYHKPGAIAGMGMELKIGEKFSIQPEIAYSQKGSRSTDKSPFYLIVRLNYIDIAGVVNFYLKPKIIIQPGLSYGVLFKARTDAGGGFVENSDFFYKRDLCGLLSVEYKFTPKTAGNIRYGYSLTTISPYSRWYSNTLSFTLRFEFGD